MSEKSEIRKIVRRRISEMSPLQRAEESMQVLNALENHPRFQSAHTIMLYYSLDDEVQTPAFLDRWASDKQLLLPVVKGEDLELRVFRSANDLQDSPFHIPVPGGEPFTSLGDIELIVVPGVAFDVAGHRMGRGRGFYDRFLCQQALSAAYKLGICFSCQMISSVPVEAHDTNMDEVICPRG